ncbi:DUF1919 domain-containing protein [Phascolarctobacterium sp.]|uniref:DUF1919 domain-containing protein n=1 Tax=Phascolarctobacterium sp. TaxID=2049039 RepID=UPI003F80B616
MSIDGIKLKIRNTYLKITSRLRRKELKFNDFTVISNNCWGGILYESYNLPKNSLTVGMFFMAEEYIKFVSNLRHYTQDCVMTFVPPEQARHRDFYAKDKRFGTYPIARIDDVEIALLHYHSEAEAKAKWERRCERINWDRLLVKMNDQNSCEHIHAEKFMKLPIKNKLFMTVRKDFSDIPGITAFKSKNTECCGLFDEPFGASRKLNINNIINRL